MSEYYKKILFKNYPTNNSRGHYTFYDLESEPDYGNSQGIPPNPDKYSGADLYTTVKEDPLNTYAVDYRIPFPGFSDIKFNTLNVVNNGVSHGIKNINIRAYIFDNYSYGNGTTDDPMQDSYNSINARLPAGCRFFDYTSGKKKKGHSPGQIIKDALLLSNINNDIDQIDINEFENFSSAFSITGVPGVDDDIFRPVSPNTDITLPSIFNEPGTPGQILYIATWAKGDADRWWGTDRRKRQFQVWSIPVQELYDADGNGTQTTWDFGYGDSNVRSGAGGSGAAEKAAFKVTQFSVSINTAGSAAEPDDPIAKELQSDITAPAKLSSRSVDLNFYKSFFNQYPSQEIRNFFLYNSNSDKNALAENFEPVAVVTSLASDEYDLSSYQLDDNARQICSAPNQISLDFDISTWFPGGSFGGDGDLDDNGAQTERIARYKFYVVDWNDDEDKFVNVEDFTNDIPRDFYQLQQKHLEEKYLISPTGLPLYHNYSTPGIKTIKAVLFSHTGEKYLQVLRWKFITTRIFLDIPINKYPDFGEFGGDAYSTLPWPYTNPIIGGVDENSKYKNSVRSTLTGGNIGNRDYLDQRFLVADIDNDEMGQSVRKYDLQQIRFFSYGDDVETLYGTYDLNTLLGIQDKIVYEDEYMNEWFYPYFDTDYWDCRDWDTDRNYCFSKETPVGEIFIIDNKMRYSDRDDHIYIDERLKRDCVFEFNCGTLEGSSVIDSTGNRNKGILIGDYKVKKRTKNKPMKRDSFIKISKTGNENGAL